VRGDALAPLCIYLAGLLAMLALSATYNMWPVCGVKWLLRRFDHSAIYLLIAGTYTPLLAQMKVVLSSAGLTIGIWLVAVLGIVLIQPSSILKRAKLSRGHLELVTRAGRLAARSPLSSAFILKDGSISRSAARCSYPKRPVAETERLRGEEAI
jgi:Haemolysin-III related